MTENWQGLQERSRKLDKQHGGTDYDSRALGITLGWHLNRAGASPSADGIPASAEATQDSHPAFAPARSSDWVYDEHEGAWRYAPEASVTGMGKGEPSGEQAGDSPVSPEKVCIPVEWVLYVLGALVLGGAGGGVWWKKRQGGEA